MATSRSSNSAAKQLAEFFGRNGYARFQDPDRREDEGDWYKKGDEVRLVARTRTELATIRRLLKQSGFRLGRPFAKGRQFVQPIYGREAVGRFLDLVGYEYR